MGIFKEKFWSVAGQKERLKNVGLVLSQSFNPFSKAKPVAEVESKPLKVALEFVAAHPYTTAAVATGGVAIAKAPAAALGKVAAVIKAHPVKAALGAVVTGIIVKSPTAREKALDIAGKGTPEELIGAGGRIGEFIEDPSGKKLKEALKGAGLVAGAAALGIGGIMLAPKVIKKVKEWRAEEAVISEEKPLTTAGITQEVPVLPETTSITPVKRPYKPRRAKITPSVRQYVRVDIINRPVATGIRVTNKNYLKEVQL